jgi:hypothetical protein
VTVIPTSEPCASDLAEMFLADVELGDSFEHIVKLPAASAMLPLAPAHQLNLPSEGRTGSEITRA